LLTSYGWRPSSDADDRLCGEVKNRINFVFAERALYEFAIADVAANYFHAIERSAAHEFALGDPISHQADDVRARFNQPPCEPAADQAACTCNKRRTVNP
jgi:hypothetical protein